MFAEDGGIVCDAGTGWSVAFYGVSRQSLTRAGASEASMRKPLCLNCCHAAGQISREKLFVGMKRIRIRDCRRRCTNLVTC
jgi:hypothetical protein